MCIIYQAFGITMSSCKEIGVKKTKTQPQRPFPYQKYRWYSLRVLWLALGIYLLMILLSFDPQDPSFNMVSDFADIINLGGYVGAILARFLLSLFGIVAFAIPFFLLQQNRAVFFLFDLSHLHLHLSR